MDERQELMAEGTSGEARVAREDGQRTRGELRTRGEGEG